MQWGDLKWTNETVAEFLSRDNKIALVESDTKNST